MIPISPYKKRPVGGTFFDRCENKTGKEYNSKKGCFLGPKKKVSDKNELCDFRGSAKKKNLINFFGGSFFGI